MKTPFQFCVLLAFLCVTIAPKIEAVSPTSDSCYPNSANAEEPAALSSLVTRADNSPASWIWKVTGSLNTPRYSHTAALLQNGMVLLAGGFDSSGGSILASAELYHPVGRTWM